MTFNEFFKRFLAALAVLLLCLGIWTARSTLIFGFAAALIAVALSIPAGWLQRRGLRRGWAIAVATIDVGLVVLLLFFLVVPRLLTGVIELQSTIRPAISSLMTVYANLREQSEFLSAALPAPALDLDSALIDSTRAQEILQQFIDASLAVAPSLLGGVGTVVAVVINLIFVLFIAIFFLVDPQSYIKASLYLVPRQYHQRAAEIWNELYRTLRLWISALLLSISITMGLVWLILGLLLGMPNAIVVAVFAGIATFIPNIGAFLPLIPIFIFTLASDPAQLVIYVPVYLLIQFTESNVITPSIVKAELEIPPGALMIFQLLVTLAFGALGLLLAVPLLAVLIVLVREIYSYDLLGLRNLEVEMKGNQVGQLVLHETNSAQLPTEEVLVAKPRSPKRVR
jgi:predicted PurR-regulated permease PerM